MAQEVVKEFVLADGIGAQFYRKIYAMCYAKEHNLPFMNSEIKDFFIHEADNVKTEKDEKRILDFFNNFLINPWKDFVFDDDVAICPKVGESKPETMGQILDPTPAFTVHGPSFNPDNKTENIIAIHIRRGNVVPGNPRWVDEDFYVTILKDMKKTIKQLGLEDDNPQVVIVTDAPDKPAGYKPINSIQEQKWYQDYLVKDSNGNYPTMSLDFKKLRKAYPGLKIFNRLSTEDAFLLMLRAKVLIVSPSVFPQCAAMLTKHIVIDFPGRRVHTAGEYGHYDQEGNLYVYAKRK